MFKKLLPIFGTLLLAFGILYASILKTSTVHLTFAAALLKTSAQPTPTPAEVQKSKVNYYLVYPGMLPDAPLYKIKMLRDKIWVLLTTEPIKKTELYLLYADKRIGAGKVLVEGGKVPLGISTIVKGEKYLELAITEANKAKGKGLDISKLKNTLTNAAAKHEEVLLDLREKVDSNGKTQIDNLTKFVQDLQVKAKNL